MAFHASGVGFYRGFVQLRCLQGEQTRRVKRFHRSASGFPSFISFRFTSTIIYFCGLHQFSGCNFSTYQFVISSSFGLAFRTQDSESGRTAITRNENCILVCVSFKLHATRGAIRQTKGASRYVNWFSTSADRFYEDVVFCLSVFVRSAICFSGRLKRCNGISHRSFRAKMKTVAFFFIFVIPVRRASSVAGNL